MLDARQCLRILRESNVSDLPALDKLLAGRATVVVTEQLQKAGLEQTTTEPPTACHHLDRRRVHAGYIYRGAVLGRLAVS